PSYILIIDGQQTRHGDLQKAIANLRDRLGSAGLDPAQHDAYLWFLDDPGRVHDFITADGEYRLNYVAGRSGHSAVIRPEG
ncbi:hypothetical protein ACFVGN_43455, partial [Streptomyces sp. NPDC057757]